jgi:uncharacterized protein (TIGR02246 family)
MTPEDVSALFARWREAWARHDPRALARNYAESGVVESPTFGKLIGRSRIEQAYDDWFTSFPDAESEINEFLITEDRIVWTATIHGTDTGGLLGQSPTRSQFRLFSVVLCDVADDQIIYERRVFDVNGLLRQLATGRNLSAETPHLYRAALSAARLEHEVQIAAEIQQALMPNTHHKGVGFEVAAASSPCRSIGGDFLDDFELPTGAFGFVLGDVSGKGPPAALLASKLQGILAAYSQSAHTPSEMLTRVNTELVRRAVESRFATVLYGVVRDGYLTYSNAGHNPPLIVGRTGVRRLERGGLILGAFPGAQFEEETVSLDPGDVLVVFSDGITEAPNGEGAEFGEARLVSSITANRDASAQTVLERLLADVQEFSRGVEQSDDLTALVLRYTGS